MARVLIVHDDVDVGMFTSMQLGDDHQRKVVRVDDAAQELAGGGWDAVIVRYLDLALIPVVRRAHATLQVVVLWPDVDPPADGLPGVDAVLGRLEGATALAATLDR
jgi:hypothetical protein